MRDGLRERAVMLAVVLTSIVVVAVLVLVLSILHVMKPKRLKVSAGVWKLAHLSFEADAGDDKKELPPGGGA